MRSIGNHNILNRSTLNAFAATAANSVVGAMRGPRRVFASVTDRTKEDDRS